MFAHAHLSRNLREQRPSNQGYLDLSITGEVGRCYYIRVDLLLISFFVVVRDCFGTLVYMCVRACVNVCVHLVYICMYFCFI
jgi:hypothetical protein